MHNRQYAAVEYAKRHKSLFIISKSVVRNCNC